MNPPRHNAAVAILATAALRWCAPSISPGTLVPVGAHLDNQRARPLVIGTAASSV